MKFATIIEKWEELEGKHLNEIAQILGYKDTGTCRLALYRFRDKGKIERGLTSPAAVEYAKLEEERRGVINSWQEVG